MRDSGSILQAQAQFLPTHATCGHIHRLRKAVRHTMGEQRGLAGRQSIVEPCFAEVIMVALSPSRTKTVVSDHD